MGSCFPPPRAGGQNVGLKGFLGRHPPVFYRRSFDTWVQAAAIDNLPRRIGRRRTAEGDTQTGHRPTRVDPNRRLPQSFNAALDRPGFIGGRSFVEVGQITDGRVLNNQVQPQSSAVCTGRLWNLSGRLFVGVRPESITAPANISERRLRLPVRPTVQLGERCRRSMQINCLPDHAGLAQ